VLLLLFRNILYRSSLFSQNPKENPGGQPYGSGVLKFGLSHAAIVCSDLKLAIGVVTDPGIPDEYRSYLVAAGVEVLD